MCGIVGIFSFNHLKDKAEEQRAKAAMFLFTELLETTSARGEDATGVTTLFDNGDYMIQKMGIASPKFISRFGNKASDFEGYLNLCRKNENKIKAYIGHCRKSSVGNTTDNENNHPIRAGEIVGIHNGTLKNHNKIFRKLDCDRDGVVDSEAIFRLLQHYTDNCKEPFTLEMLQETVRRLDGSYSCITYNANNPYQISVFRKDRPMEFALIKSLGIMIIASEKKFIDKALYDYNKQVKLYKLGTPIAKSTDTTFAALPNDSVGIIDLTQQVTKKTLLPDLVLRDTSAKITKIWQQSATNTYYRNQSSVKKQGSVSSKSKADTASNVNNTKATSSKKSNKVHDAKVFCKELNRYVSPELVKEAAKVGSVEISTDKNVAIDIEKDKKEKNTSTTAATATTATTATDIKKDIKVNNVNTIKTEVDVSVSPEIVEESKNSKEALLKYSSNKDLANDIDASDETSVASLEAFALANRIRKHTYENAFLDGAKFYKKNNATTNNDEKLTNAQKVIRIAKRVIKVLALSADLKELGASTYASDEARMIESLDQEDSKKEITVDSLDSLITDGDKRDSEALALLESVVKEEKNGKTDTVSKI